MSGSGRGWHAAAATAASTAISLGMYALVRRARYPDEQLQTMLTFWPSLLASEYRPHLLAALLFWIGKAAPAVMRDNVHARVTALLILINCVSAVRLGKLSLQSFDAHRQVSAAACWMVACCCVVGRSRVHCTVRADTAPHVPMSPHTPLYRCSL